jgi:hypothetical protein
MDDAARSRRPSGTGGVRRWLPAAVAALLALTVIPLVVYLLVVQNGQRDLDLQTARAARAFQQDIEPLLADAVAQGTADSELDVVKLAAASYLDKDASPNPDRVPLGRVIEFSDGQVLVADDTPQNLRGVLAAGTLAVGEPPTQATASTPAGDVRVSAVPMRLDDQPVATLQLVASLTPIQQQGRAAAGIAAGVVTLVTLSFVLLAWRQSRRQAASLAGFPSHPGLGTPDPPASREPAARDRTWHPADLPPAARNDMRLGEATRTFNALIDRLEEATVTRPAIEPRFEDELLTVLGGVHDDLVTALGGAEDHAERQVPPKIVANLYRAERLVDDLEVLLLPAGDIVNSRPFELRTWFHGVGRRLAGVQAPDVPVHHTDEVIVEGDPESLARAVLDLVAVTETAAPPEAALELRALQDDAAVGIEVAVRGEALTPDARARLLERLGRQFLEDTQGLEMAAAVRVATAHRGGIHVDDRGDDICVLMTLPRRVEERQDARVGAVDSDD